MVNKLIRSLAFGTWRNTFMGRTSRCVHGRSESVMPCEDGRAHTQCAMPMEHVIMHHAKDRANVCATRPHRHRWPAGAHSATYPGVTSHSLTRSPALIALRQMLIRRGPCAHGRGRTRARLPRVHTRPCWARLTSLISTTCMPCHVLSLAPSPPHSLSPLLSSRRYHAERDAAHFSQLGE
jgi:hypothetical protein